MEKDWVEVKVMGIVMDQKALNPVVILADLNHEKALPIWIGVFEAEAISRGLEEVVTLRPMTHDLLKQILDTFRASVIRVVINDLKGNTYYASLYLNIEGEECVVDSRPSDAIALAVRVKAPIYVTEAVFAETKQMEFAGSTVLETEEDVKNLMEKLRPEDFGKFKM
jgi:uncharacterized protein